MEKMKRGIREMVNGIPPEIRRGIDGLLAPYGLTLDSMAPPGGEGEEKEAKESLDTVYMTVKQAEEYTHFSRWSLGRYAKEGKIKTIKMNNSKGGKVLFERESLDKWLHSR